MRPHENIERPLSTHHDEDARCDREDRHKYAESSEAKTEQGYHPTHDQPDAEQKHTEIFCRFQCHSPS